MKLGNETWWPYVHEWQCHWRGVNWWSRSYCDYLRIGSSSGEPIIKGDFYHERSNVWFKYWLQHDTCMLWGCERDEVWKFLGSWFYSCNGNNLANWVYLWQRVGYHLIELEWVTAFQWWCESGSSGVNSHIEVVLSRCITVRESDCKLCYSRT